VPAAAPAAIAADAKVSGVYGVCGRSKIKILYGGPYHRLFKILCVGAIQYTLGRPESSGRRLGND